METVLIGTILYGYCRGYFGRDAYDDKRIEGIGVDWIVAREIESQSLHFAEFESENEMLSLINEWKIKKEVE